MTDYSVGYILEEIRDELRAIKKELARGNRLRALEMEADIQYPYDYNRLKGILES